MEKKYTFAVRKKRIENLTEFYLEETINGDILFSCSSFGGSQEVYRGIAKISGDTGTLSLLKSAHSLGLAVDSDGVILVDNYQKRGDVRVEKYEAPEKLESELQREIVEYLKKQKCLVFRMNTGYLRSNVKLAPAGTPDILCISPTGKTYWIEVKRPKQKQRASQRAFEERIAGIVNHEYYVVTDVSEVKKIIG